MSKKPTYDELQRRAESLENEIQRLGGRGGDFKANAENFDSFLNNSPVGMGIIDRELRYVFVNDVLQRLNGPSMADHIGKHIEDVIPEGAPIIRPILENILATAEPFLNMELAGETPSRPGELTHYLVSYFPMEMMDGKPQFIGVIVVDITKQKNAEARLQQAQKMESVGRLAGGIAHDFNNLLGIIIGNISFALSRLNQADGLYEVLTDVMEGARRAQSLTDKLLTFSKGGAPIKKNGDLNTLLKETAEFITAGSSTGCEFNLAEDLWPVAFDPSQLYQAILNIMLNAQQAMPDGGVIRLETDNVAIDESSPFKLGPGNYIKISIRDHGVGIAEQHLSMIFDPFFTTKQKGSGLGLSATYSIVLKHEGHVTVDSQLGEGTVFNIYLPTSEKAVTAIRDPGLTDHAGEGRILVMDDDPSISLMTERMLTYLGYECTSVRNGTEAIQKYAEAFVSGNRFDLVILDLTIPGDLGGKETVTKLLEIDPDVKAVVSSGYSTDPVMANHQEYGFCGVVPKPFTHGQIARLLSLLLGRKK